MMYGPEGTKVTLTLRKVISLPPLLPLSPSSSSSSSSWFFCIIISIIINIIIIITIVGSSSSAQHGKDSKLHIKAYSISQFRVTSIPGPCLPGTCNFRTRAEGTLNPKPSTRNPKPLPPRDFQPPYSRRRAETCSPQRSPAQTCSTDAVLLALARQRAPRPRVRRHSHLHRPSAEILRRSTPPSGKVPHPTQWQAPPRGLCSSLQAVAVQHRTSPWARRLRLSRWRGHQPLRRFDLLGVVLSHSSRPMLRRAPTRSRSALCAITHPSSLSFPLPPLSFLSPLSCLKNNSASSPPCAQHPPLLFHSTPPLPLLPFSHAITFFHVSLLSFARVLCEILMYVSDWGHRSSLVPKRRQTVN
jgi:hypothetical protein